MISLFMMGGPSQMDLFDHKPMLTKWHGQKFPGENLKYDNVAQASPKVLGSFWKFSRHGKCGMELSELLPQPGTVADDLCRRTTSTTRRRWASTPVRSSSRGRASAPGSATDSAR